MNLYSNAGQYKVMILTGGTAYIDLTDGLAYSIAVINPTNADVTAGTLTIEHAPPEAGDPCTPDGAAWRPLEVIPECDALPGAVSGPATITFSPEVPLPAYGQCQIAAPCPDPFVRVTGTVAGAVIVGVLTRLRGSAAAIAA